MRNAAITISEVTIQPGTQVSIPLRSSSLYTQTNIDIPVHIIHGRNAGPKLFITGAIHGDELNSIEIIRRLHNLSILKSLRGTLITLPVVNVFGFLTQSRYLPDHRDLNRCFPGSHEGSLAARLAHILIEEIVMQCNYGIDLHTGTKGHNNLPQLRVNLATPGAENLARAFNTPIIIDAKIRDGSLRQAAGELGIPLLVYEAGEALRFNEIAIRMGLRGILNVLRLLAMIPQRKKIKKEHQEPIITSTCRWLRAPISGLIQAFGQLGKPIKKGDVLALIHDPFIMNKTEKLISLFDGIIIGQTNLPLVNEGDAIYNIAIVGDDLEDVSMYMDKIKNELENDAH